MVIAEWVVKASFLKRFYSRQPLPSFFPYRGVVELFLRYLKRGGSGDLRGILAKSEPHPKCNRQIRDLPRWIETYVHKGTRWRAKRDKVAGL